MRILGWHLWNSKAEDDAVRAERDAEWAKVDARAAIDFQYQYRPRFAFVLNGSEAVMRSDGAVLMFDAENGEWFIHSRLPGTWSARPDDDTSET